MTESYPEPTFPSCRFTPAPELLVSLRKGGKSCDGRQSRSCAASWIESSYFYLLFPQGYRVSELGAYRDMAVGEGEIRDLREAVARGEIGADDFYIALFFFEDVADVTAFRVVQT